MQAQQAVEEAIAIQTPLDHRQLEVMTPDECDRYLSVTPVGRVAFISNGGPLILPITYQYADGRIVFRTSHGEKLAAADRAESVGFEIDTWDDINETGWSVVIQGTMERVHQPAEIEELERGGLVAWAAEPFSYSWIRITPAYVSGRRLR